MRIYPYDLIALPKTCLHTIAMGVRLPHRNLVWETPQTFSHSAPCKLRLMRPVLALKKVLIELKKIKYYVLLVTSETTEGVSLTCSSKLTMSDNTSWCPSHRNGTFTQTNWTQETQRAHKATDNSPGSQLTAKPQITHIKQFATNPPVGMHA